MRKGLNFDGWTLAEIRRRVRGESKGVGEMETPQVRQPEHIGDILERIGFGKQRGRDNERETRND